MTASPLVSLSTKSLTRCLCVVDAPLLSPPLSQAARYLACQPRAETPPYSDEDEDPLPEGQMLTAEPLSAANGFFAPLTTSPRPLSPATHELARHAILPPGVASAGLSIRRTSSPPTLEQIARRLRGTAVGGPSAPPRRNSEPPVSPRSTTTSLPALAPVRAETLPSRLPTFLLNRARAQPVPAIASTPTRVVPGRPSSSTTAPGSAVPVRVGSAAVSRPRMVIQEIPTFKLTPPPEREERALALRQRLARGAEERASANILIERRRSTGSSLADALLQASEGGGLRVPGL
jgi:hypothetical protein